MSRTVAWTGHRPDLFRSAEAARDAVHATARELVAQGAEQFLVGGQRGVDTWAAQAAIAYGVPFSLILPFEVDEFAQDWSVSDRQALEETARHATEVSVAGGYTERNRRLATEADLLIAVWTRTSTGGTAETVQFAREAGTTMREIVLESAPTARYASGRGL